MKSIGTWNIPIGEYALIYNYTHTIRLIIEFNPTNITATICVRTKISKFEKYKGLKVTNSNSIKIKINKRQNPQLLQTKN